MTYPFENDNFTCVIITAFVEGSVPELLPPDRSSYFLMCADGGYKKAFDAGVEPDLIIGDFDSYKGELPPEIESRRLPVEKDDTDTRMCVRIAAERGHKHILIIGGLGGRLDHTFANIQTAAGALNSGVHITFRDKGNEFTVIRNSSAAVKKREHCHIGIFSLSEISRGVSYSGLYYDLSDYTMTSSYPIGVSNEFTADEAVISVKDGTLLIVLAEEH